METLYFVTVQHFVNPAQRIEMALYASCAQQAKLTAVNNLEKRGQKPTEWQVVAVREAK